jgi:capsular polysaccharide biosynthesis protein
MSALFFQFEHLGQVRNLDLEGSLTYFVEDAISRPFANDSSQQIATLVAHVDGWKASLARSGMRVDALGRERFAARVPSMVALADMEPSNNVQMTTFEALSEPVPYVASHSPDGTAPASLSGGAGAIRPHHVAVLADARVCVGPYGQAVFDKNQRYVDGICRGDGLLLAAVAFAQLPPMRTFDGTLVSLCSCWSNGYFHWMLEALPKLLLIEQAGHRLADIDLFMVRQKSPALMSFLAHLGIPDNKVFEWHFAPHIQASRLIVTSSLENYDSSVAPQSIAIEPWASRIMQQRFSLPRPRGARGRRIYIDRENAKFRKVINDSEVKAVLHEYDIEVYTLETLSFEQKRELFTTADVVIGPGGAGFANLLFCQPGCHVLIFYNSGFESNSFWTLCNNNGHKHFHLVSESSSRYFPSVHDNTINENFLIDINALRQSLKFIFEDQHNANLTQELR